MKYSNIVVCIIINSNIIVIELYCHVSFRIQGTCGGISMGREIERAKKFAQVCPLQEG